MSDVGWTLEDLLMAQQPVEMHALLECAGRETSSWGPGRMPPTTTLRYLLLGMDFAASAPRRWRTIRLRYQFPDLSQDDLATMLGVTTRTVRNHLRPVKLAEEDEFFNKDIMSDEPIRIIKVGENQE